MQIFKDYMTAQQRHVNRLALTPRTSDEAKIARAALEHLDLQQIDDPDQRQHWTPAYRQRVEEIVDLAIHSAR